MSGVDEVDLIPSCAVRVRIHMVRPEAREEETTCRSTRIWRGKLNPRVTSREGVVTLETGKPPRYLALDVGSKRIGVAVSDELGLTAQPVMTLIRRRDQRDDLRSVARLSRRYEVAGIVVGNPLRLSGESSPQTVKTQAFAAELGELTGLPILLWDERLSTRDAQQLLYESGHKRQTHRRVVDQVAATLILQEFINTGMGRL